MPIGRSGKRGIVGDDHVPVAADSHVSFQDVALPAQREIERSLRVLWRQNRATPVRVDQGWP